MEVLVVVVVVAALVDGAGFATNLGTVAHALVVVVLGLITGAEVVPAGVGSAGIESFD